MVMTDTNNSNITRKFNNLFSKYTFGSEVVRLMGLAVLAKPLGVFTQMLLAKYYGTSVEYDAYVLSFFLVTFIEVTIGRVFTAVYMPMIIKLRASMSDYKLEQFKNAFFLVFLLPGIVYTLFLLFTTSIPVKLAAPKAPQLTLDIAVTMVRFMALPGLLMLLVAMGKAVLNSNRHFRIPALMPATRSALFIVCVYFLHESKGIWALPISFAISSVSQVLIIWITSIAKGNVAIARPSLPEGAPKQVWVLSQFIFVSTALMTINEFLDKMFASSLIAGSISTIAYSVVILNFSVQIIQLSLNTVMFTKMSEFFAEDKFKECSEYLVVNFKKLTRLVVPFALTLMISATEIVRVLFQRGEFDEESAIRTSMALSIYMIGLPALVINLPVTRIFHTMQRMRDKVWLAVQYLSTNAIGNFLLIGTFKVAGLAISSAMAITLHLILSLLVLSRYNSGLAIGKLSTIIVRAYIIGIVMWLIYSYSGLEEYAYNIVIAGGIGTSILVATIKAVFVFVIFMLITFARAKVLGKGKLKQNV